MFMVVTLSTLVITIVFKFEQQSPTTYEKRTKRMQRRIGSASSHGSTPKAVASCLVYALREGRVCIRMDFHTFP